MSAEGLVKRIAKKYVWPLDTEQAYGVYLGSDNLTAYRIVKAVTPALRDDRLFFARNAVESAIREALLEMAGKLEASGANAAAAIVREEAERG